MFLGLLPSFFLQSILMFLDCIHTLVQHSQYHNTPIIHIQNSISFWAHGWWTPSFICIERVYGLTVTLAQWHRGVSWTAYQLLELLNAPWELLLPYFAFELDFVFLKLYRSHFGSRYNSGLMRLRRPYYPGWTLRAASIGSAVDRLGSAEDTASFWLHL